LAARATGDRTLARRARRAVKALSEPVQIESHRRLLARVRRMGLLPDDAAANLDARWEEFLREHGARSVAGARGKAMRKLLRAIERRGRRQKKSLARALEKQRRKTVRGLETPTADVQDRDLKRFAARLRAARDLSSWIGEAGGTAIPASRLERDRRAVDALDRWREPRAFERRLRVERRSAEDRGSVTLALGLDRVIGALEVSLTRARRDAVKSARIGTNVVAFERRSA